MVEPIVLGVRVLEPACDEPCRCCCCACDVPESICACLSAPLYNGNGDNGNGNGNDHRTLAVSIGIFSLVRLIRPAQYLINASEFIIPDKECVSATPGDPCELFRSMAFPVTEFAPPPMPVSQLDRMKGSCGCSKD